MARELLSTIGVIPLALVVGFLLLGAIVAVLRGRHPVGIGWFALGTLVLTATWWLLFGWGVAVIGGLLTPWDIAIQRPPLGSWSRSTNDLFEGPGSLLPGQIALGIGAVIFVVRFIRDAERRWLPWLFAATTVAFVMLNLALTGGLALTILPLLSRLRPGIDLDYARTGPLLVVALLLLAGLFFVQARVRIETTGESSGPGSTPLRLRW